jgi:hypothetical protein
LSEHGFRVIEDALARLAQVTLFVPVSFSVPYAILDHFDRVTPRTRFVFAHMLVMDT